MGRGDEAAFEKRVLFGTTSKRRLIISGQSTVMWVVVARLQDDVRCGAWTLVTYITLFQVSESLQTTGH
eukprot:655622-Prorocentrum_minimum.AAC.3